MKEEKNYKINFSVEGRHYSIPLTSNASTNNEVKEDSQVFIKDYIQHDLKRKDNPIFNIDSVAEDNKCDVYNAQ